MHEFIALFFAFLIGLTLGMMGSGGSILTLPVMVYVLGMEATAAAAYSLFVVGITAGIGTISYVRKGLVRLSIGLSFAVPSVLSVLFVRHFVVPNLPEVLWQVGTWGLGRQTFLMSMFALLISAAAFFMLRPVNTPAVPVTEGAAGKRHVFMLIFMQGIAVGALAGLVGAGGGFMIIPSLVLILGLSMQEAVGTSLLIIAINSLLGFVGSLHTLPAPDWQLLLTFTGLSIAGILSGTYLASRLPVSGLRKGFAWFLVIMGLYILLHEWWQS